MFEPIYIEVCFEAETLAPGTLPVELDSYTLWLNNPLVDSENFYIGQTVSSFNGSPVNYTIYAIVYKNLDNTYTTTKSASNSPIGIILLDHNNNFVTVLNPTPTEYTFCVQIIQNQEEVETVNCFKQKIYNLQCKYSEKVECFNNALRYGISNKQSKLNLLKFKLGLEILNKYDVRDLFEETMDYNTIPYSKIEKILSKLNTL